MRKYAGLRVSDTEGLRGEAGMGRMHGGKDGDAGGKGQKRQRQKCGRRDRDKGTRDGDIRHLEGRRKTERTLKTETETKVQMQRRTGTGQGGGAQDSDGADCRGSEADWKEGLQMLLWWLLGPRLLVSLWGS